MTFQELTQKLGYTPEEGIFVQHANGEGWKHKDSKVDDSVYLAGIVVYGDAWVSGDARVYGDAQVYGDAWKKSPLFILGSKHSLTNAKKGHIQGCKCEPFAWWKTEEANQFARENGYSEEDIAEYAHYIDLFIAIGK